MRICIAGAGIAGCVAGLLLNDQGHDVHVFEAVPEVAPLGVGINLLPHAVEVLSRIGLAERLEGIGIATHELVYYNKHGQRIWGELRGRYAGYQVPQISVHRGRLQMILLAELERHLGAERLHTDHRFVTLDDGQPVRVTFARGNGVEVELEADLFIGADGIHSRARQLRYPQEGLPRYGGRMLWRATSRAEPYLTGASMIMAGHQDCKFVAYPIDEVGADGRQTINWIAELTRPAMPERESWNRQGTKRDFAGSFLDWSFDWLDIPALIEASERVFEFPLVDRDPLPGWTFGATTLLGDAAHPMYPIGSNGASQGILDAASLAAALGTHRDLRTALSAYESSRLPATAAIVLANRENGPEQCMQIAEERAPGGFANIDAVFGSGELEAIAARYKAVAGFAVGELERQSA